MNPLKLNRKSRKFYEALVDLNTTDVADDTWLEKYRKVKRIKQAEGRTVIDGWRCFYHQFGGALPLEIAEHFY